MDTVDLVIAVWTPASRSNVVFELGFAAGRGKQLAVFVARQTEVPSDLTGVTYCGADINDKDAVGRFLDIFLKRTPLTREKRHAASPASKHGRRSLPPTVVREADQKIEQSAGHDFERFVRWLFQQAGYIAEPPFGPQDYGVDFAIWIEGLDYVLGNPLLVQVKAGSMDRASLQRADEALRQGLLKTHRYVGLLIYRAAKVQHLPMFEPNFPLVVRWDARRLLRALALGDFEKRLVEVRNLAAHGLPAPENG
jgi:hypothetical protein